MFRKPVAVLLIEDSSVEAALIRLQLSGSKDNTFDLECAENLQEGFEQLGKRRFDIILLDLMLPDSDGLATFYRVNNRVSDIPIVILTGMSDEKLAIEAVRGGAQDYLVKAEDLKILPRSIFYAIERKRFEVERNLYIAWLEKKNVELQEFSFVASHDLQEPLRKIKAFGEQLRRKCGDRLDEIEKDYLGRMECAANRMQQLIRDLLDYSRITFATQTWRRIDLKALVEEVAEMFEVQLAASGGRIEISALPVIEADPAQMKQLFENLIGNALKFQDGSRKPSIRVHCRQEGATWAIFVEDNGIGFEKEYLDRIFSPFQRLHGRTGQYEGTGMGLAICRKIVDHHGGSITAGSTPGRSSTFMIILPVNN